MSQRARRKVVDVVLVDLNGVLSGIVEGILAAEPHVRVVARTRGRESLRAAITRAPADVAIVGGEAVAFEDALRDVLCEWPRLRALAVGGDGVSAAVYELRPHRTPLGELSPATLLDAVTGVGEGTCAEASMSEAP